MRPFTVQSSSVLTARRTTAPWHPWWAGDRTIHLDRISEQWDRMGQFYASLESGQAAASTALKRLAAYSGKNRFYRANRELGRIFKTEYILQYMSDPLTRQRVHRSSWQRPQSGSADLCRWRT